METIVIRMDQRTVSIHWRRMFWSSSSLRLNDSIDHDWKEKNEFSAYTRKIDHDRNNSVDRARSFVRTSQELSATELRRVEREAIGIKLPVESGVHSPRIREEKRRSVLDSSDQHMSSEITFPVVKADRGGQRRRDFVRKARVIPPLHIQLRKDRTIRTNEQNELLKRKRRREKNFVLVRLVESFAIDFHRRFGVQRMGKTKWSEWREESLSQGEKNGSENSMIPRYCFFCYVDHGRFSAS